MVSVWKTKVLPGLNKIFDKDGKKAAAAEFLKSFNKEEIGKEIEDKKTELEPKVVEVVDSSPAEIKELIKDKKPAKIKKNSAAVTKFLEELAKIDIIYFNSSRRTEQSRAGAGGEEEVRSVQIRPIEAATGEGAEARVEQSRRAGWRRGHKGGGSAGDVAEFPGAKQVSDAVAKSGTTPLSGAIVFIFDKVAPFVPKEEPKAEAEPAAAAAAETTSRDVAVEEAEAAAPSEAVEEKKEEEKPVEAEATPAEPEKK